jgi:hypothetical protein
MEIEHISPDCTCIGRQCTACTKLLCHGKFSKQRLGRYGLSSRCKECQSTYNKRRQRKSQAESQRRFRQEYPERAREYARSYHQIHPEKRREQHKRSYQEHPEKPYERKIKRKYGLTLAEYQRMLEQQQFCCALCHSPFEERKSLIPHVDHIHGTKHVRGILHNNCNIGIGLFNDDVIKLHQAIRYLQHNTSTEGLLDTCMEG